jgi:hypothetical protein
VIPPSAEPRIIETLAARLRGERVGISATLVAEARRHRVHLLLAETLSPAERREPAGAALVAELRSAAILTALRDGALHRLLDAFAAAPIETLVLKGAALAHTIYPAPHLRPRADLDLLIASRHVTDADRLLIAEGWTRALEPDSTLASAQRHYQRRCPSGITEQLDLHWKIANLRVFGDAVTFEELWTRAERIPTLGGHARTPSRADALFIACVHRVAHHDDAADLLWLWDVHVLVSGFSAAEADRFVDLAVARRMRAVCTRGVALAAECFHTPGAAALVARLDRRPARAEPSARLVGGDLRLVDLLRADLAATAGWRARITLVSEHLFPARSYMRSVYGRWPAALLPLAYAHRIVRGAPKWFRTPSSWREPNGLR